MVAGLATALRAGALTADAVALEARKAAQAEDEPPAHPPRRFQGVSRPLSRAAGGACQP